MRARWIGELLRRPGGAFGAVVVVVLVVVGVVAPFWTPQNPFAADPFHQWEGPSAAHLFGTTGSGIDVFSYLFAGTTTTVVVAFASAAIAGVVGVVLALLSSLTRRWIREPLVVLVDVLIAFPTLLIAIMLAAVFGASTFTVVLAVGIGFGVNVARVVRSEVRRVAREDYVLAARASGAGPLRLFWEHILPNAAPVLILQLSLAAGTAILAEAALSFLGYGVSSSVASWGQLLSALQNYVTVHPGTVVWPGLVITITVLGFTLLGDALRDATDPRLRRGPRTAPTPDEPVSDGRDVAGPAVASDPDVAVSGGDRAA